MSERLEETFPKLSETVYIITSPATDRYNCIAWVAGDTDSWWWPDPFEQEYWPDEAPREETLEAFVVAFTGLGYALCLSGELEAGFEKLAFYADGHGVPTHAARQLRNGQWTSKLGAWED